MSCRSSMDLVSPPPPPGSSCTRAMRHHSLAAMRSGGIIDSLLSHARVRAARAPTERSDETTPARQAALSSIPAPTGAETARGVRAAAMFRDVGLVGLTRDDIGYVPGGQRGRAHSARPPA